MNLQITINISKEKVKLLEKYGYDFESNCEARILEDWQDTYNTEEATIRHKKIYDSSWPSPTNLRNIGLKLNNEKADN